MIDPSRTCCLSIGNTAFQFNALCGQSLPALYAPFASELPCGVGGATYDVVEQPLSGAPLDVTYWSGPAWRMGLRGDRLALDVRDPFSLRWLSVVEADPELAEGCLFPWQADGAILHAPVDRVLMANRLALVGHIVVHASAIRTRNGVLLFCGRSGIGKSTMADLWGAHGKAALLNDDRAVAYVADGVPMAGGTPWHGKNPAVDACPGPLLGICHLRQAPQNQIQRVSAGEAAARLLATSAAPFYYLPGLEKATHTAEQLCEGVPSYDVGFVPTETVVSLLESEFAL